MPAYICVEIEIHDPVKYEEYKTLAPGSIAAYGGRYLTRGGAIETLEGDWHPRRLVLLEFPSMDRARAWWNSPEYAKGKAMRQASATSRMLLLEGLPEGWTP
jgi:uncharacterized protein (DUF1330 family)